MSTTTLEVPALGELGYVPPTDDGKTITAPEDHPHGGYQAGDAVEPFDMTNAHLRIAVEYRTPSRKISAEARRASTELARRRGNKPAKKLRHSLALAAVEAAGL